jgi:cation diffusion facilitator CzcD-associated flavoprotein CzcO
MTRSKRTAKRKHSETTRGSSSMSDSISSAKKLLKESELMTKEAKQLALNLVNEGAAIAGPLLEQTLDESKENPNKDLFQKALDLYEMALELDEESEEARDEIAKLLEVFQPPEEPRPEPNHDDPLDVVIVGAGASGVGMGLMLTRTFNLDPERVLIVERGDRVGETFHQWPKEMRFISPSFNSQGWTQSFDLNSVAFGTSPAYTLQTEHPTGQDYAHYLNELAVQGELNIKFGTEVTAVKPKRKGGFTIDIKPRNKGENGSNGSANGGEEGPSQLKSKYVIWAAGEFQFPQAAEGGALFPGSDLCRHNSSVDSWKKLEGDDFVVIGGYESGMDALYNLTMAGKKATVVSSTAFWKVATDDPSTELAPYTMERVRQAFRQTMGTKSSQTPRLMSPLRVFKVEKDTQKGSGFLVHAKWGEPVEHEGGEHRHRDKFFDDDFEEAGKEGTEVVLHTPQAPMLCTGFAGSCALGVAKDLFEWGEEGSGCMAGAPIISELDESTTTPGLFLCGPAVRHEEHIFCFVYKYRQRFGVVADAIARGLDFDTEQTVDECRQMNMFLDDFSCCKGACGETC